MRNQQGGDERSVWIGGAAPAIAEHVEAEPDHSITLYGP